MRHLELSKFGEEIFDSAKNTKGSGSFSVKSAIRHLERACQLIDSMPEVAIFLAITAQEESAASVFHCLQKKKYDGAHELKREDHKHKSGVYPFLKFIKDVVLKESDLDVKVTFSTVNHERPGRQTLRTVIPLPNNLGIYPDPPLNIFSYDPNGIEADYHKEIKKLASKQGIDSVFDYIKKLANERNKVLYASPSGIPQASDADRVVLDHAEAVVCNFITYLLIEPYPQQKLVQEALNAYLKILKRL